MSSGSSRVSTDSLDVNSDASTCIIFFVFWIKARGILPRQIYFEMNEFYTGMTSKIEKIYINREDVYSLPLNKIQ